MLGIIVFRIAYPQDSVMPERPNYRIHIVNDLPRRIVYKAVREGLETLLATWKVPSCEISVLITDNDGIRQLNKEFRKVDEATDVLTFPAPSRMSSLGDIAISVDFASTQAKKRKVRLQDELAMLAIHGGLHLMGMDDELESDREAMVVEMNRIAKLAGIPEEQNWSSLPHGSEA